MTDVIGPTVRLCVFGRLRIIGPDGVEQVPGGYAPRTLLAFLALHGGSVHAEQATTMLWPDLDAEQGRQRLRNVLVRLRQAHGPIVQREGVCLVLRAKTDLAEYQRALTTLLRYAGQELAPDVRYSERAEELRRDFTLVSERLLAVW